MNLNSSSDFLRAVFFFGFVTAGIFCQSALCESDSLLDEDNSNDLPLFSDQYDARGEKNSQEQVKSEKIVLQKSDIYEQPVPSLIRKNGKMRLDVSSGAQWAQYELSGTGFTASIPFGPGYGYGFGAHYRASSGKTEFGLNYSSFRTDSNSLVGVVPQQVSTTRSFFSVQSILYFTQARENFGLVLGYEFKDRNSTRTSPNQVIGNFHARGPFIGITDTFQWNEVWSNQGGVSVSFLNLYDEEVARTGYRRWAGGLNAYLKTSYSLSRKIEIGVRVLGALTSAEFDGGGTRGIVGAKENEWIFSVPIEMSVYF